MTSQRVTIATSFNSRAPRGARHYLLTLPDMAVSVSIHVPLAEHDGISIVLTLAEMSFNSRAPRGARLRRDSIKNKDVGFNSRAPRGARLMRSIAFLSCMWFQFTCPSRSTTRRRHLPRRSQAGFNSRAPRGARPQL